MDESPAVRARGIGKSFGDVIALDEVDLDLVAGQVHGLVGPNGVAGSVGRPGMYPSLTPKQNLSALFSLRGRGAEDVDDVLEQVGLTDVADDRVRGFSPGMPQRLGLAAALRYVADGDGPNEVNGIFRVRAPYGDAPNPLWQFDGLVDLLNPSGKD